MNTFVALLMLQLAVVRNANAFVATTRASQSVEHNLQSNRAIGIFGPRFPTTFLGVSNSVNEIDVEQKQWKPKIASFEERQQLRQCKNKEEKIGTLGFHHIEFVCGDAKSMATQFSLALGMPMTCMTGQSTGNDKCVSYGLQSGNVRFLITAPYSQAVVKIPNNDNNSKNNDQDGNADEADAPNPLPSFDAEKYHDFFRQHGLAGVAVGVSVQDAKKAYDAAVGNGAVSVLEPTYIPPCRGIRQKVTDTENKHGCHMAEVRLYGDVVLRFISFESDIFSHYLSEGDEKDIVMPLLPHLKPFHKVEKNGKKTSFSTFGLDRIDHAVGNVPNLYQTLEYVQKLTGFHEFAEFTPEDVGTVDSGLNSVVLASDNEYVLLPLNEPTQGKRKSQIQTFLEQNEGAGLQHLALKTHDIFSTIQKMKFVEEEMGIGFELMRRPSDEYYRELPDRLGDKLTSKQYSELEELGLLADADEEGVLLQVFTKPIGDRPTFFIEIIQRIGCQFESEEDPDQTYEQPGCGGFGKGNFRELFKAIEEHEKTLKV
jgi:4-hydroxyphenylpyruvate dioxygenase